MGNYYRNTANLQWLLSGGKMKRKIIHSFLAVALSFCLLFGGCRSIGESEGIPEDPDRLIYWQKGQEKVEIRKIRNADSGMEQICAEFQKAVYLRDYEQLEELSELYGLAKYAPLFHIVSPFDKSEAEYLLAEGGFIGSVFTIPGGGELCIKWGYFKERDYNKEWLERRAKKWIEKYETADCQLYEGDNPIICYSVFQNLEAHYSLEWAYQDVFFRIENLPYDEEILDAVIRSIQDQSYVKDPPAAADE